MPSLAIFFNFVLTLLQYEFKPELPNPTCASVMAQEGTKATEDLTPTLFHTQSCAL